MKHRKPPIVVKCLDCPYTREVAPWEARKFVRCKSCAQKSKQKNKTPEQRQRQVSALADGRTKWIEENRHLLSERGKYARSKVNKDNISIGRIKQQQTILANPEKYAEYCEKRRDIALDFHKSLNSNTVLKAEHYQKVFGSKISKAELEFFNVLEENDLIFERQTMISGFFVDGFISDIKLVVEFYGDAHHCNPKKFQDPNRYCSWISRTVGEQWMRDRRRLAALYKNGCKVLIIWQTDWVKFRERELERIRHAVLEGRTSNDRI